MPLTPDQMKALRHDLDLTVSEMALLLRLNGANGGDKIREYERGAREPSGPMMLIYELLRWDWDGNGGLPDFVFAPVEEDRAECPDL